MRLFLFKLFFPSEYNRLLWLESANKNLLHLNRTLKVDNKALNEKHEVRFNKLFYSYLQLKRRYVKMSKLIDTLKHFDAKAASDYENIITDSKDT